jgi:hypothetical protein
MEIAACKVLSKIEFECEVLCGSVFYQPQVFVLAITGLNMQPLNLKILVVLLASTSAFAFTPNLDAQQQAYSYQIVPRTIYEKKPVTVSRWVNETVEEKKKIVSYSPVWQTETRERTTTTYKPVQRTSEREVKSKVFKPVTKTLFREKRIEETVMEEVTKFREEKSTVREPVVETSVREENVTVRKPVTQSLIEVKRTTTYKPVVTGGREVVPAQLMVPVPNTSANQRPRMKMLDPGYYTDPQTGLTVYRRRGLHWVQPNAPAQTLNGWVEQDRSRVDFVPETVEERKPIEVTRYVDKIETRKVPVEVKRMVERTETKRIPYTVKEPRIKVTIEQIPYTETTYEEEVVTKKVPITETEYVRVVETEPYEVETKKWVPVTREVAVPRTVRKRVEYEVMQNVPRTVLMKIPVDVCGNQLAGPTELYSQTPVLNWPNSPDLSDSPESESNVAESTTNGPITARKVTPETKEADVYQGEYSMERPASSVLENDSAMKSIQKDTVETAGREMADGNDSGDEVVLEDEAETNEEVEADKTPSIPKVNMPEENNSESGDENADKRA